MKVFDRYNELFTNLSKLCIIDSILPYLRIVICDVNGVEEKRRKKKCGKKKQENVEEDNVEFKNSQKENIERKCRMRKMFAVHVF
jgi:hypothetical protein